MAKLRVHNLSISLDGYAAGLNQTADKPFGDVDVPGPAMHDWMFATLAWHRMVGEDGGSEGIDNDFASAGEVNIGATVMGRNMFGPIRGSWDDDWKGWWGPNPPYHHPVFVLTHHAREPIPMEGGTTFHFVTEGIEAALAMAFEAAGGADVRIGGGASTVQQYLRAGLVDEMHIVIVPILLGAGERLFDNLGTGIRNYECVEVVKSTDVVHVRLARSALGGG
jgi:dihydrofolate reductase